MHIILAPHEQCALSAVMERLRAHQARGEKAYLMVPEQFTLQSDIHLLDALEREATMDIRVKSFTSLAREVLERLGDGGRAPLTELGRSLLLRFLIERHREELEVFGRGKAGQGVITALAETLAECKSAGIRPEALREESKSGLVGDLLSRKLHDVSVLLTAYETMIEGRYLDNEDRLGALEEAIPEAHWLRRVCFYFYGFHGLTALELRIVAALQKAGIALVFALPLPGAVASFGQKAVADHDALQAAYPYWEHLKELADAPSIEVIEGEETLLGPLATLADETFTWAASSSLRKVDALSLRQGISSVQEVTVCAQEIRRRVMREGARYRDFTIAVTNPDEYAPLLRRIFEAHGIPVFIDQKRYLVDNSIIRALLALFELLEGALRRETVIAYLKSGFSEVPAEALLALERYSRRRALRGEMFFAARYYEIDPTPYEGRDKALAAASEEAAKARRAAECFEAEIRTLYESTRKEATVETYARLLYHFLSAGPFREGLDRYQAAVEAAGALAEHHENSQVLDIFVHLLEQLVSALGGEVMAFGDFAELLRHGLSESNVGIIPPAQDQVLAGTLGRTRSHRSRFQYILGMSDAWLPSREGQRTVFLGHEKEQLSDLGLTLLSMPEKQRADEMMALYQAFTRPTEELIFSWPLSDARGQSMNQARLIGQVRRLLPEQPVESLLQKERALMPYSDAVRLQRTMSEVRRYMEGALPLETDPHWSRVGAAYGALLAEGGSRAAFLETGLAAGRQLARLDPAVAQALYPGIARRHTSITELEQFRQCPYRHFVRYGLRPALEEDNSMERREAGTILHEVFAQLTEAIREEEGLGDRDELRRFIAARVAKEGRAVLGEERLDSPKNTALLTKVERSAQHAAKHILRQLDQGRFRPVHQELHFGEKRGPRLVMQVGREQVILEGSIDRVDRYEDSLRIVDYKTGSKGFDLSRAWDGLDLQLLLYLRVALGLEEGLRPAGIFYLNVREELVECESDDREALEKAIIDAVLMDGLVVSDPELLAAMDVDIDKQKSTVVRFRGMKKKTMEKDNVLAETDFLALVAHAEAMALRSCQAIFDGAIDILPARIKDQRVCAYCDYAGICRIEEGAEDRPIAEMSYARLAEALKEEGSDA